MCVFDLRANIGYIPEMFTCNNFTLAKTELDTSWMTENHFFIFIVHKMTVADHFGNHFRSHFSPLRQYSTFFSHKMVSAYHFGCTKITFDHISNQLIFSQNGRHQPSQINRQLCFQFFSQNGHRRPFWML